MRYISINSSDPNDTYSFFIPIVARAWKRLGYSPVSLLLGKEQLWTSNPKDAFCLQKTKEESQVFFVSGVDGYRNATVMQVCRVVASAIQSFHEDDYLLTSDVDMIPLSGSYFKSQDIQKRFHIFSADAYADITKGLFPPKFPMCYLGARAGLWRDIMGIRTDFDSEVAKVVRCSGGEWGHDEMYCSARIMNHPVFKGDLRREHGGYSKGECQLMIRTWPFGHADRRADRDGWCFDGRRDLIDAHCFRPGYKDPQALLALLRVYFQDDMGFFQAYIDEYVKLKRAYG